MANPLEAQRHRPLHVVHLAHGFGMGGLENVVAELVRHLPRERYRHTVVALTAGGAFAQRVAADGVEVLALHKAPGHAVPLYPRLFRLLRQLKPDVLHTCNLAALEVVPLAWLARVPLRVHAEHGWDAHDPHGTNPRYQRLRRAYRPFVNRYVAVSAELQQYLLQRVGVPQHRVALIANGVDTLRFTPAVPDNAAITAPADWPFVPGEHWVIGTVGRMMTVKNQPLLARAFVEMVKRHPQAAGRARLAFIGDGPLLAEVKAVLDAAGLAHLAWMPGARMDVDRLLPHMQTFVLPSVTEGTSCTLQEAMASGVPVVATAVGGTPDVVAHGHTGLLVPAQDEVAMAEALWALMHEPRAAQHLAAQARRVAVQRFSMHAMVRAYDSLFSGKA